MSLGCHWLDLGTQGRRGAWQHLPHLFTSPPALGEQTGCPNKCSSRHWKGPPAQQDSPRPGSWWAWACWPHPPGHTQADGLSAPFPPFPCHFPNLSLFLQNLTIVWSPHLLNISSPGPHPEAHAVTPLYKGERRGLRRRRGTASTAAQSLRCIPWSPHPPQSELCP